MTGRTDPLETARLAIEVLRRIPRTRKASAAELKAQLDAAGMVRDIRTIQRLLETLTCHFDIERDDSSKPFGYRWKESARGLALPTMSAQEALLLTLAEQHLRAMLPARLLKSMQPFFQQARRNLAPERATGLESEWLSKVRVVATTQPLLPATIRPGVLEEVSEALYANRWLEVDYENARGVRSVADVMPLGLAQQGPALYLVVRFRGYDDERSLALHRMHRANASTLKFERPKSFNLAKHDADGRFGLGYGKRIRLIFTIDKGAGRHLLETRLARDQVIRAAGSAYEVSATVVESEWLWRWIRGFGKAVKNVEVDGKPVGPNVGPRTTDGGKHRVLHRNSGLASSDDEEGE